MTQQLLDLGIAGLGWEIINDAVMCGKSQSRVSMTAGFQDVLPLNELRVEIETQ